MKIFVFVALLCTIALVQAADECTLDETCVLPDCRCFKTELSSDIPVEQTPQLVMLTFDDAVTVQIYDEVMPFFGDMVNPDGCNVGLTFFVSHEYTDYEKVNALWSAGHELALHSISHSPYTDYWREISAENLTREFADQRTLMAHFGQVDIDDLQGVRVPLFELSGDRSFELMKEIGLTYDSSWPTQSFINPGAWPYTLDHKSGQDCPIGNCPTGSIPGVWVMPILNWEDIEGVKCAMVDACRTIPTEIDEVVEWLKSNFHRSYNGNRAPFGVYLHAAWFFKHPNFLPAYKIFVEYMNSLPDVYLVTSSRALQYVRDPRPLGEIVDPDPEPEPEPTEEPEPEVRIKQRSMRRRQSPNPAAAIFDECPIIREPNCNKRLCELTRIDVNETRWMTGCQPCPSSYPWKGNPYGDDAVPEPEN